MKTPALKPFLCVFCKFFCIYLFIFGWQVGCEDGTVKLFEVCEGKIQFERNLAKQKGRVLSLSWHPSGSRIAAGMMGMIRIFDTETGKLIKKKNPGPKKL